jgi:hypothetical protein
MASADPSLCTFPLQKNDFPDAHINGVMRARDRVMEPRACAIGRHRRTGRLASAESVVHAWLGQQEDRAREGLDHP